MKLYDWQQREGVIAALKVLEKEPAVCLAWYTGAGKTNVFAEICRRLARDPKIKIGISAFMTLEIKDQVYERLKLFGLQGKSHVCRRGTPIPNNKNIYIFNPQGIYRRKEIDFKLDLLIIDEGHSGLDMHCLMLPKIRRTICTKETKTILVSATPWDVLALKEFKDIKVLKRPIDQGLTDGLVTDYTFHAEEAQITFKAEDFGKTGDLKLNNSPSRIAVLKSACIGKMAHIVKNFPKELGGKCLVVCPPGSFGEVARQLKKTFGGEYFLEKQILTEDGEHTVDADQFKNLERFKTDPTCRFLYVVNKCQTGFDMKELTSVVDLSMTRNIKILAQRTGRIARKHGRIEKHYFYVYDKSLMKNRLEWLVSTMIDFSLGAYDGWTTRSAKWRQTEVNSQWTYREPWSVTLKEVVNALRKEGAIETRRTLQFMTKAEPRFRNLAMAVAESQPYADRTDMWKRNPGLYKWFRLNAKAEMDKRFPLKHHIGKWTEAEVIKAMKSSTSRMDFNRRFTGAAGWVLVNKRQDLRDKHLPKSKTALRWTKPSVLKLLNKTRTWTHLRNYSGARDWMRENGGEPHWRKVWCEMHGKAFRNYTYNMNQMRRPSRSKGTGT